MGQIRAKDPARSQIKPTLGADDKVRRHFRITGWAIPVSELLRVTVRRDSGVNHHSSSPTRRMLLALCLGDFPARLVVHG